MSINENNSEISRKILRLLEPFRECNDKSVKRINQISQLQENYFRTLEYMDGLLTKMIYSTGNYIIYRYDENRLLIEETHFDGEAVYSDIERCLKKIYYEYEDELLVRIITNGKVCHIYSSTDCHRIKAAPLGDELKIYTIEDENIIKIVGNKSSYEYIYTGSVLIEKIDLVSLGELYWSYKYTDKIISSIDCSWCMGPVIYEYER